MNVSAPFIARPVATSLLAVAVLIIGLMGYRALPVSSLPQVDFPTLVVTTNLPGASPETMAALVTGPLERQLGQIPALTTVTSTSSFGLSQITLQFALDRDIDGAAQDVQSAINAAGSALPRTLPYPPTYTKANPADAPILTLALTAPNTPVRAMADLADTLIAQRLAEIGGVGRVAVQGGSKPAIRVKADLAALAAKGLSLEDLRTAVSAANVSAAKGSLDGAVQSHSIAANDQITSAKDYALVTIAFRNSAPVLLRDVATIADGFENERVGAWRQARPAVVLDIQRQPGANVVATVDRIRAELPRLARALPADVSLDVVADRTEAIRASIHDVQFTLALSVGLVIMVVLLFLRTWAATIIAGVTLPLSLIGTFAVMWSFGYSLDNLSLMALTIGTGFVVDDAIVMIENIARHREEGGDGNAAARRGSAEIGFTIISLTVSLLAVFIPLLFMSGLVGRMFREFAVTLSIAVVVSAIVSLTLTPMMCARLLKPVHSGAYDRKPGWLGRLSDGIGDGLARFYASSLAVVLRHRGLTLLVTIVTVIATIWLYVVMPKSFLPVQDTGLFSVTLRAAPDVSFEEMTRLQAQAGAALRAVPEIADIVAVVGTGLTNPTPNIATLSITLRPHAERRRDATAIVPDLEAVLRGLPGVTAIVKLVQDVQIATRASWSQYQYTLVGAEGAEVRRWGRLLLRRLAAEPGFANVASIEDDEGLEARIVVDRVRAGQYGVSLQAVSDALNNAFAQRQISTIYGQANQYRVVLEVEPRYRSDPSQLETMRFTGAGGVQVPLPAFARIERGTAPLAISHQEQFPAFTISFDLTDGQSLGDAVRAVQAAEREIGMPGAVTGSFSGEAEEFRLSLASQPWLILAAILAIYIVLGVLYESYIHPLTILSTLPSAGIGALLALAMVGEHLTIIGVIGIVLLMGIVKKNAILMIDFALHAERHRGLSPEAAIIEACALRFRPIMMTTLAALFGALPLALATGPGAELRMPLGVSIIGGLLLSQLLTLYTTPVVYLALDRLRGRTGEAEAIVPAPDASS
ncbi:efflux RND transporter permease subunit [Rhabdaerophilum sp. SD176]|uniref:efflux RND transporter permease subunit n=1 Tax=Rhabdaerophilum sp. SD176 TaxID=2983548 RepID=UPI0024DF3924|nr:efflux RND transporter permease subunit [Rhabdaerophilum sp. SD176]